MLTTTLAGLVATAIAMGAFRILRARIDRARRLYDPVFFARRLANGSAAGVVFRRPAL